MGISGSQKAKMYALGGIARGGATRGGYIGGGVFVTIGGVHYGWGRPTQPATGAGSWPRSPGIIIDSLSITDVLDETPNRAAFRVMGTVPGVGDEVVITLGSKNNLDRLFGGFLQELTELPPGENYQFVQCECSALDYTWLISFRKVTKRYRSMSASAIIADLVVTFAGVNGFTAPASTLAQDLPALDEITFTNEDLGDCITRVCRRIGAYWYVDYLKQVHAFFTEVLNGNPTDITPTHPTLSQVRPARDKTQGLTRVVVEGRGSRLRGAVGAGETRIPVDAIDMFIPGADVSLKLVDAAARLSFTGTVPGGAGALVGPGMGPSGALTLTPIAGTGVDVGTHAYVVTFTTAVGESLPGPVASVTLGGIADPTVAPAAPTANPNGPASFYQVGDTVALAYTYSPWQAGDALPEPETIASPTSPLIGCPAHAVSAPPLSAPIYGVIPYSPDTRVKTVHVYMWSQQKQTALGNGWARLTYVINQPAQTSFTVTNASMNYPPARVLPTTNTTTTGRVTVSNIPVGVAAVTGKKLYRSAANTSTPLKLLATLPATDTTFTDLYPDSGLGAVAPGVDTSGLTQPDGQLLPGASSLPVTNTAPFQSAGGWAEIGNGEQVIRYTGFTGQSLSGIPASGIGAITAAISYNSTVTACPMITGIPASGPGSIAEALVLGQELYLLVEVNDASGQTALAAQVGGDGIREEWIQDRRLSVTEARARGNATLALRPLIRWAITYTCRDLRTASGKTIVVNLPAPFYFGVSLKIQQVTIRNFRPYQNQLPTFVVDASSVRFSFEDLLRRFEVKV